MPRPQIMAAILGGVLACCAAPAQTPKDVEWPTYGADLANTRYRGGVSSYLEVLDSERQLFDSELGLVRTRRDEMLAVVRIYKTLGGGWQDSDGYARAP